MKCSIVIWFLLSSLAAWSQDLMSPEVCGTIDTPDPDFDHAVFQSFRQSYFSHSRQTETIQIPILPRIVRHTDGSGGLDPDDLEQILADVNRGYSGSNFEFYYCDEPSYVNLDIFFDFDRSLYADSLVTYNIPGPINVYFINKVLNDETFICGYASFPWYEEEYVVVKNSCALNGSTTAHEIGHYLGLYHTHSTASGDELVNGTNCLFTGDLICDTPADPRLGSHNVSEDCVYTGDETDLNNQRYTPDPTNIMSYSRKSCRTYFSPGQFARMAYYYEKDRSALDCNPVLGTSTPFSQEEKIKLFPNPAGDHIFLQIAGKIVQPSLKIEISNLSGQVIRIDPQISGQDLWSVSIANLPAGVYFINISQGTGVISKMFVKQ